MKDYGVKSAAVRKLYHKIMKTAKQLDKMIFELNTLVASERLKQKKNKLKTKSKISKKNKSKNLNWNG